MQRWDKPNPLNPGLMQYPTGKWVAYTDYEHDLAEKDLAVAQANRHKEELFQKLVEKDAAYQQLMEKAVRFAGALEEEFGCDDPTSAHTSFLQSPEVQAWKELT